MSYQAHVFHDKYPNGRASGTLNVTSQGLVFTRDDESITIALENISMRLGGASSRLVLISHPDLPDYSFYTSDRSLLNDPLLPQRQDINRQVGKMKRHRLVNRGVTVGVLVLLLAAIVSPFFFMNSIARFAASKLPPVIETEIGEKSFAQYSFDHDVMESEEGKKALEALTSVLVENLPDKRYSFHFYVVSDPNINAFALPGGYVVINTGLIQAADSAEEVLGVVAHEISHVSEQHGIRHLISSAGIFVVVQTVLGDMSGMAAVLADAAPMLVNQQYSRDFENEADEKGYRLLVSSNINPGGLITFFEKLLEEEKKILKKIGADQAVKIITETLSFLSTHPATQERIAHLQKMMIDQKEHNYRDMSAEFAQLKKSALELVTE